MEKSIHSIIGEAAGLRWSIGKFRKYLWGNNSRYCHIEVENIFEQEAYVPHVVDRWRAEFLQYPFLIWHRQARMM